MLEEVSRFLGGYSTKPWLVKLGLVRLRGLFTRLATKLDEKLGLMCESRLSFRRQARMCDRYSDEDGAVRLRWARAQGSAIGSCSRRGARRERARWGRRDPNSPPPECDEGRAYQHERRAEAHPDARRAPPERKAQAVRHRQAHCPVAGQVHQHRACACRPGRAERRWPPPASRRTVRRPRRCAAAARRMPPPRRRRCRGCTIHWGTTARNTPAAPMKSELSSNAVHPETAAARISPRPCACPTRTAAAELIPSGTM